ncbi:MAG TPA: hypothetical protein EYH34_11970, partial [Planctomycetes bacterium]|nr:hypothetical protein [Planctomycetota bacterium]
MWQKARILLASGAVLAAAHTAMLCLLSHESRLFSFIYERGWVQHAILAVAAVGVVLLYERHRRSAREAKQFGRFRAREGHLPEPWGSALRRIEEFCGLYG